MPGMRMPFFRGEADMEFAARQHSTATRDRQNTGRKLRTHASSGSAGKCNMLAMRTAGIVIYANKLSCFSNWDLALVML